MSFDPQDLRRLSELGRQLPERLPTPDIHIKEKHQSKNTEQLHPVETEDNPEALFHELMKASPDGSVPPHLLKRLQQVETKQLNQEERIPNHSQNNKKDTFQASNLDQQETFASKRSRPKSNSQEESLYLIFRESLLEDEQET